MTRYDTGHQTCPRYLSLDTVSAAITAGDNASCLPVSLFSTPAPSMSYQMSELGFLLIICRRSGESNICFKFHSHSLGDAPLLLPAWEREIGRGGTAASSFIIFTEGSAWCLVLTNITLKKSPDNFRHGKLSPADRYS